MLMLTHALNECDFWMNNSEIYDDEEKLDEAVILLGKNWKILLSKSNLILGMDIEYTRPCVETLLEEFQEKIADCNCIKEQFKWE